MAKVTHFNRRLIQRLAMGRKHQVAAGCARYSAMAKEAKKANQEDITGKRLVWSDEENKMVWR